MNDRARFFISTFSAMSVFLIVACFAKTYGIDLIELQKVNINPMYDKYICYIMYTLETFIIFKILTDKNSMIFFSIFWCVLMNLIGNTTIIRILEVYAIILVPFIITKQKKYAFYGFSLAIVYNLFQLAFLYCVFGKVDYNAKYTSIALIGLILYYQFYVLVLYFTLKEIKKMKNLPSSEIGGPGPGGSWFIFGKREKLKHILGAILIGIVTLGIEPLFTYVICKKKSKK